MKKIFVSILVFGCIIINTTTALCQQAQDPTGLNQEIDIHIDRLGDATMELRMKMTALQWQSFKASSVASNPTIFKRDMERQMASLILEEVKTDLDENNRTSRTTVKARGMAQYKGNGKWEVKMDMKDPNVTKVSDNCFLLTGNLLSGGMLIQQLQKIFLPEGAGNVKQDTDTFGNAVITYEMNAEPTKFSIPVIAGIVLMMGGAGTFAFRQRFAGKK
jgi:hypothetical protein